MAAAAGAGAMTQAVVEAAQFRRYADAGELYAIIDACDRADVPPRAWERGARAASLFAGTEDAALWAIAPYLFEADAELLEWIAETRAADAWGVFVVADCGLEALASHLRELLLVRSPNGERMRFRFYDPRVLPGQLESCDADALRGFFGPARAFGVATDDGARLLYSAARKIRVVAESSP
ncbi:MAG TPA: DUF4123 domain-containing protein [Longimicrobium sp.]|jgi:hypothetical protein